MEERILTWNLSNFVTVSLMVAVGLGAYSIVKSMFKPQGEADATA